MDTHIAFGGVLAGTIYAAVAGVPWDAYVVLAVGMMVLGYAVAARRRQ